MALLPSARALMAASRGTLTALVLLGATDLAVRQAKAVEVIACSKGEAVIAFFVDGEVMEQSAYPYYAYYYYSTAKACEPSMAQCYFSAKVNDGPDKEGYYTIDWDDGDTRSRRVHGDKVRRTSTGELCGSQASTMATKPPPVKTPAKVETAPAKVEEKKAATTQTSSEDDMWVPPEIPCTVMVRLHWEGSDPEWNKKAVDSLRKKHKPDELIDGFDWHVILRFNEADRCESTYKNLEDTLNKCTESDIEKCRTHEYVKAIEYVGDDPETRRKTGRGVHDPKKAGKTEL